MVSELRPRGIGEILDTAVALYRARFRKLTLVTATVVIPVQVLSALVLLSAQPESYDRLNVTGSVSPQYDSNSALIGFAAFLVITVVSLLSTAFVIAVCTRIVADAYIDRESDARDAVRAVSPRLFAIIGLTILVTICDGIGLLFCGIGVLVPLTLFAVAIPALILEGITVSAAVSRSINLTKANVGHVLGVVLTARLLVSVLSVGLSLVVIVALRGGGNGVVSSVIGQSIANAIAAILTTPFVATATVTLYFDLRIRNEAFDVQLLMQRNEPRVAV